ncbi:unnamed protein product [[Actinomadura] parvosata subsp. kistnae]|nr:unnamed protein product [Actinomadura parvosata subsp. kistnae]
MKDGRVVEEGEVDEVFTAPRHPYTRDLVAAVPRLPVGGVAAEPGLPGGGVVAVPGVAADAADGVAERAGSAAEPQVSAGM